MLEILEVGAVGMLHPEGRIFTRPTMIWVVCSGPTLLKEKMKEGRHDEEGMLLEGWKQQVGAKDLLYPERIDLGVKKTTRNWAMTKLGDLTSSRTKNVVIDNSKKIETTVKKGGKEYRNVEEKMARNDTACK